MHLFKQEKLQKTKLAFAFAAGVALVAPAWSSAQNAMSLKDCINAALGQSPELELAKIEASAAESELKAAQAGLLPYLKGIINAELFTGRPLGPFALENSKDPDEVGRGANGQPRKKDNTIDFGHVWVGGAELTYPIFKDGSFLGLNNAPAVASAKAKQAALAWTKNQTREDIIFTVSEAYFNASIAAEKLRQDERAAKLAAKRLEIVKSQVSQGLKVEEDVKLAESQARVSDLILQNSRQQASAALAHLGSLIGQDAVQVDSTYHTPPQLPPMKDFVDSAMRDHPSIGAQKATIEEAKQNYRLAESQIWPTVNLDASTEAGGNFDDNGDHLYRGVLKFEVPIFDFGQRGASARASRDHYRAEELRLAIVTKDLRRSILDAYNAILTAQQSLITREVEVQQTQAALKRLQTEQESGKVAPLGAVEAEITLVEKEKLLEEERSKQLLQYATLQKLAGGSWQWLP